jgi:hypothetical protein
MIMHVPVHYISSAGACGTGWVLYNQNCYYFGNGSQLLTWFDARTTCNQMGAELASIHSQDEDNMLVGQVQAYSIDT